MSASPSCPFFSPPGEERGITLNVVFTPSEEVTRLRDEILALQEQIKSLKAEVIRAQNLYQYECIINLELQDLLDEHHIPFRQVLKGRNKK